jgi:hypothetical protein
LQALLSDEKHEMIRDNFPTWIRTAVHEVGLNARIPDQNSQPNQGMHLFSQYFKISSGSRYYF